MEEKSKKYVVLGIAVVVLVAAYFLTKNVSPEALKEMGLSMPLPLFTFLIAIIDGFNPCNLFVLTLLLSLVLSESHSRKKIYAIGFSFIGVVYVFYFLFMVAWLNVFKYIGFIDPLRIGIGVLAIVAGLINCKEYFFYRKGITLMVQDKHVGPLKKRIRHVADVVKSGSIPALIGASIVLAVFASLVELPCTAGFPIIYTGVLTGMALTGLAYYKYILLYNLVYVLPLIVIITVLGYTFKGKQVEKSTMALIKFIGGAIMLLLGIILLVNPGLIVGA
ncbi:hypothetical protein JXA12_03310 [Candidatus Woesearchaeota archaeon]|nr:hypothetical protein [Candidatus Woesearchaeota archaeon]